MNVLCILLIVYASFLAGITQQNNSKEMPFVIRTLQRGEHPKWFDPYDDWVCLTHHAVVISYVDERTGREFPPSSRDRFVIDIACAPSAGSMGCFPWVHVGILTSHYKEMIQYGDPVTLRYMVETHVRGSPM